MQKCKYQSWITGTEHRNIGVLLTWDIPRHTRKELDHMETRTYARTDLIAIKIPKSRIIIKTLDIFLAEHLKSLSFSHQSYPFIHEEGPGWRSWDGRRSKSDNFLQNLTWYWPCFYQLVWGFEISSGKTLERCKLITLNWSLTGIFSPRQASVL